MVIYCFMCLGRLKPVFVCFCTSIFASLTFREVHAGHVIDPVYISLHKKFYFLNFYYNLQSSVTWKIILKITNYFLTLRKEQ